MQVGWGDLVNFAAAPPKAHAHLFSATGKEDFYRRFGFAPSPKGMSLALDDLRVT